jgi:hypothetical protein
MDKNWKTVRGAFIDVVQSWFCNRNTFWANQFHQPALLEIKESGSLLGIPKVADGFNVW